MRNFSEPGKAVEEGWNVFFADVFDRGLIALVNSGLLFWGLC